MKVKIKICGIRSLDSAKVVVAGGADFIGFNFVTSSKRYIDTEVCKTIINDIKGKIKTVGVFQNASIERVNTIADLLDLDFVQLHGKENEIYMKKINRPIIRSIHSTDFVKSVNTKFLLLDREKQGRGNMFDLKEAKKIAVQFEIFFAGGLTPENVVSVIEKVKPFAVDIAGGIETDGKEDFKKIKEFIARAKGAI